MVKRLPSPSFTLRTGYDLVEDRDCSIVTFTHHSGKVMRLEVPDQEDMSDRDYHEKVLLPAVEAIRSSRDYQALHSPVAVFG